MAHCCSTLHDPFDACHPCHGMYLACRQHCHVLSLRTMRFIKPLNGRLAVSHANVKYELPPVKKNTVSVYASLYFVTLFFTVLRTGWFL